MEIILRIILGITMGVICMDISKRKKYNKVIAFLLGFILPILGTGILIASKDIPREKNEEEKKQDKIEEDELNSLINNIEHK